MMERYILGIDQSTQGTKALLFDRQGSLIGRSDRSHRQIVNQEGWVSHDPMEIYQNVLRSVKEVIERSAIRGEQILGVGLSNQRETSVIWDAKQGVPLADAIVWQCDRATKICQQVEQSGAKEMIRSRTGLLLSPYFPAAKLAWLRQHTHADSERLRQGTMDTWLLYKLTGGKAYKTDYSNASRTQLFDIHQLKWDPEICRLFGIDPDQLPEVCDSNACFGKTDFEGLLPAPVPIHGVMGDSHGALFGQGCFQPGMVKATYGTGSSIMMNIGERPVLSEQGLVTSLAWGLNGQVQYVLEGNLNYTGAVISWLKDDLRLIDSLAEIEPLLAAANPHDRAYLVPAFTGLGAPYWNNLARASLSGMSRTTGKAEVVRAAVECIGYQITDIIMALNQEAPVPVSELRVDGGPTNNRYLMQFQSDMAGVQVQVPKVQELSGLGVSYAAGLALGMWDQQIFTKLPRTGFCPQLEGAERKERYQGWQKAIQTVLQ